MPRGGRRAGCRRDCDDLARPRAPRRLAAHGRARLRRRRQRPRARELDNAVLERAAFVCCDSLEQARQESGDLSSRSSAASSTGSRCTSSMRSSPARCGAASRTRIRRLQVERPRGVGRRDRRAALDRARERGVGTTPRSCRSPAALGECPRRSPEDLRAVQQAGALIGREAVLEVPVLEDLGERRGPARARGSRTRRRAPRADERRNENGYEEIPEAPSPRDCILAVMKLRITLAAVRRACLCRGRRRGREERIVIWIERQAGRSLGGRARGQSAAPAERRAPRATTTSSRATSSTTRSRRRTARSRTTSACSRTTARRAHQPFTREELPPARALFFGGRADGRSAGSVLRPLQVRVRDRVAVRVVGWEAERLVDPRLELLREGVLEPVGLVVDVVDVRSRASPRGRARAGGGGGSPRARPARRRASASRRGTARARRARARRAS